MVTASEYGHCMWQPSPYTEVKNHDTIILEEVPRKNNPETGYALEVDMKQTDNAKKSIWYFHSP